MCIYSLGGGVVGGGVGGSGVVGAGSAVGKAVGNAVGTGVGSGGNINTSRNPHVEAMQRTIFTSISPTVAFLNFGSRFELLYVLIRKTVKNVTPSMPPPRTAYCGPHPYFLINIKGAIMDHAANIR